MPTRRHKFSNRAGGDLIATIRFAGSICIVTRHIPESVRFWSAITAAVLLLFALISAVEMRRWPWLLIIGLFLFCLAIAAAIVAAGVPDTRIVCDAGAKTVRIFQQHLWSATESLEELPFSSVYSIGVNVTSGEEGGYTAVLRMNGGRNITLWELARPTGWNPKPES